MCTQRTIGEIFLDRPDHLVLTYAAIVEGVDTWEPNTIGAAKHSVVFSNKRAWLIVKPMKKMLDVKFYTTDNIDDPLIFKSTFYFGKYAHHIRVDKEEQITPLFFDLIRLGFDFAMR